MSLENNLVEQTNNLDMPLPQFQRPVNRSTANAQDLSAMQKPKGCAACSARMKNEAKNSVNIAPRTITNPNVTRWRAQK